jgi:polar amino acid transport system permease protein
MEFWELFGDVTQRLFGGFAVTLEIFGLTLLLALPLGLIIAFGAMSKFKPLSYLTKIFIWVIRGVPLMLQVIIVYYLPGDMLGLGHPLLDRVPSVILAFVINYACYFAEIYRGGIESIARGQYEAGMVLGMTRGQIFFRVVLPQVVKRILAPMSNEVITLVKDTALARVIMVAELIKAAEWYSTRGLMWPLFYTAVFYLVFVGLLSLLFGYFEKKLDYYKV